MLTFLPALILLLLHGPANMNGGLVRAGERADVGAQMPVALPVAARSSRGWFTELLRKFPGATALASLVVDTNTEVEKVAPPLQRCPDFGQVALAFQPSTSQRNRDGPRTA